MFAIGALWAAGKNDLPLTRDKNCGKINMDVAAAALQS
jgi:hypothetical protein